MNNIRYFISISYYYFLEHNNLETLLHKNHRRLWDKISYFAQRKDVCVRFQFKNNDTNMEILLLYVNESSTIVDYVNITLRIKKVDFEIVWIQISNVTGNDGGRGLWNSAHFEFIPLNSLSSHDNKSWEIMDEMIGNLEFLTVLSTLLWIMLPENWMLC